MWLIWYVCYRMWRSSVTVSATSTPTSARCAKLFLAALVVLYQTLCSYVFTLAPAGYWCVCLEAQRSYRIIGASSHDILPFIGNIIFRDPYPCSDSCCVLAPYWRFCVVRLEDLRWRSSNWRASSATWPHASSPTGAYALSIKFTLLLLCVGPIL